jgi:hypothetical protein
MCIPGASLSEIYTMKPFTITVKRPSVRRIAGSDRIMTIGLRIALTIEKISPAIKNTEILLEICSLL